MFIKNISFFSLLFTVSYVYSSALVTGLMIANIQEKKQTQGTGPSFTPLSHKASGGQRNPLFTQAEQYEDDFINAQEKCLQAADCDINKEYERARYHIVLASIQLNDHLNNINKDISGLSYTGEKTEAKNIKRRLTELLKQSK